MEGEANEEMVSEYGEEELEQDEQKEEQESEEEEKYEEIEDQVRKEFECKICFTLMVEPTKIACGHRFCI